MPFGNRKIILEYLFFFLVLPQFKIHHPSRNKKINNLGIFQSLKLHILMEKILIISLKLNFTPNTLDCYGLTSRSLQRKNDQVEGRVSKIEQVEECV